MVDRSVKVSISLLFFVCRGLLNAIALGLGRRLPATFVVLMYHSINQNEKAGFCRQMDFLKKVCKPVAADFRGEGKPYGHHVAVTFDDGFANVFMNAVPILMEKQIPATFFITTGYLGRKPGWIRNREDENAEEAVMTEEMLAELVSSGFSIGSHSVSHPWLTRIEDEAALGELLGSKKRLEELVERPVMLFSIPYGDYNQKTLELARKIGYMRIFLNIPARPWAKETGYLVGRVDVSSKESFLEFKLKCLGGYQWLGFASHLKREVLGLGRTRR